MDLAALFSQHVERLQVETEKALGDTGFDSLVVSSGAPFTYFADDRDAPFEPIPHFAHWCPLGGPHHLLHLVPGQKAAARPPRAGGLLVRAGRRDRPLLARRLPLRGGGLGRGRLEGARPADERRLRGERDGARGRRRARGEPGGAHLAARLGAQLQGRVRGALPGGGDRARRAGPPRGARGLRGRRLGARDPPGVRPRRGLHGGAAALHDDRRPRREGRDAPLREQAEPSAAGACCCSTPARSRAATPATSRARRRRPPATRASCELVRRVDALEQELAARGRCPGDPTSRCTSRPTAASRGSCPTCGWCGCPPRRPSRRATPTPSSRTASATTSASRCTTWRAARPTPRAPPRRRRRSTRTCGTRARSSPATSSRSSPGSTSSRCCCGPSAPGPTRRAFDWDAIDALTPLGGVRVEDNVVVTAARPAQPHARAPRGLSAALRPRRPPSSSATSSSGVQSLPRNSRRSFPSRSRTAVRRLWVKERTLLHVVELERPAQRPDRLVLARWRATSA